MKKNKRYAMEGDIDSAAVGAKLNFGGHLYMRVVRSEERVFNFRVCLSGKDTTLTIGKYPDMSLAEAREVARLRQSEVEAARKENAADVFQARLRSFTKKKNPQGIGKFVSGEKMGGRARQVGFNSLNDAGKFLVGLDKSKDFVSAELSIWIALKLMIPCRKDYLLRAKWSDLDAQDGVLYFKRGELRENASGSPGKLVAPLSTAAKRKIKELSRLTGKFEDMFPELKSFATNDLRKSTAEALVRAWPHYSVHLDEFPEFFERIALQHSLAHNEIVEGLLTHRPGSRTDYNPQTYNFQLHFLAEWWGEALDWFSYGHAGQFWGIIEIPTCRAQVLPQFGII